MSITKIEYPTLEATRVAAMATHGDVREKKEEATGNVFFFNVKRSGEVAMPVNLHLIGYWKQESNYGVIYPQTIENK
jgi:hypothetical protein